MHEVSFSGGMSLEGSEIIQFNVRHRRSSLHNEERNLLILITNAIKGTSRFSFCKISTPTKGLGKEEENGFISGPEIE